MPARMLMQIAVYCSIIVLLTSGIVHATKRYVSPSGNDNTGNGTIGSPYRTIQKGIDVATANDSVMALAGNYPEDIAMKDQVAVIGAGYETTTIDGNGATAIVTAATALIQGFTIRDGETAILYDGNSSPTVLNNFITECYYGFDGYIPFEEGPITPTIRFNIFETILWGINMDEQAFATGGVNGTIENNTFLSYPGAQFNTGIRYRMHQSLPVIRANIITGCQNGIEFTYETIFDQRKLLVSCNDVWGNDFDYIVPDNFAFAGYQGNIAFDPGFCSTGSGDYSIYDLSPCAPENNSCAILIGAVNVGCNAVCGDANHDGTVNISDPVFMISYIFAGGPAPVPYFAADSNCDGTVNISDPVYLISYIFAGGPEPCASCSGK